MQIEYLGFAAGSLTTFCWLPQAAKIFRTRETRDISLAAQAGFTSGCALWTVYGLSLGSPSIVVFNIITTALAAAITLMKLRFG